MRDSDTRWASRFYGMAVPTAVVGAADEGLTQPGRHDDLVDAHLAINYAYFGAIDKTLSGFVVLDDEGDNYTLLDLRDGGQIWWQDHETRQVSLRFDRFEDLLAVRDEIERAGDEADRAEIEQGYRAAEPRANRLVPSSTLLARYQWLVWLLAQPLEKTGSAIQRVDELVRGGIGRFRQTWPRREQHDAAFEAELGELATDPHLAIYWLLHTLMIGDDARRALVVEAIGDGPELVQSFVTRFGRMPLAGPLPIVPAFRTRRALALTYGAFELLPEEQVAAAMRSLEIEPGTSSLMNGLTIATGIERGQVALADVAATVARIAGTAPGVALLRAVVEKKARQASSSHADELARLLAGGTEPWWFALEAMWLVHELAYDANALLAATRAIVVHDRYHRRALQMAMRAAQIAGEPIEEIERIETDLELADAILQPYSQLVERPDELEQIAGSLEPRARAALAYRTLQRSALNVPVPAVAVWAVSEVMAGDDPDRGKLVGASLAELDAATQQQVLEHARHEIDAADHPLIEVLLAMLDGPEPAEDDFSGYFAIKRGKEAAIVALAPWVAAPNVFDRIVKLLERPAGRTVIDPLCNKLFSPFQKETYVVPRLDGPQAERVILALIEIELRHPQIHARNAAGHQLFRFSHRAAEELLIGALTDFGKRNAELVGRGQELDHGQCEAEQLEKVVANLYAAVRGLETPRSRTALIQRLFDERKSYWRMGDAIKEAYDDKLHAEVVAALLAKRDLRAAGTYAYALANHVKKAAPLVALARELVDWDASQAPDDVARRFFRYALVVGEHAALEAREYDLVRRLHAAQLAITEPPLEPDDHARGRGWKNPLDDAEVADSLAQVLSGEADAARRRLAEAGVAARAAGKPNVKISDAQLGELAGAAVERRILHDRKTGEVWFRDGDKRIHYFDGYAVVPPPFVAHSVATEGLRAQLTGVQRIDERVLEWDARAANLRELVRLGSRVLVHWGSNNGRLERLLCVFPDDDQAAAAFAQLRANPPKGFAAQDPYYVAGKGAVVRTYYVPLPDGSYTEEREPLHVGFEGDRAAEIAGHERREVEWLRDRNATLITIEWSDHLRRNEDLTVRAWITKRFRDDARDPIWHLRALAELASYLETHLAREVPGLALQLGAPASDADIDAFAVERDHPVPDSLRSLWRAHGRASWKLDGKPAVGLRLLGPREALARRPAARAAGAAYLQQLTPAAAERARPLFEHLDVIVETLGGEPVTFVADIERADGRVFTHAYDDANDLWWEVSLSWMLATRLLGTLEDVLVKRFPLLSKLMYGERPPEPVPKASKSKVKAAKPTKTKAKAKAAKAKPMKSKPVARPTQSTTKPAPKKPTPKKPTPKKPTPTKPTPKKPTPTKPTPKKPTPTKPTPKKPTPKKPKKK